MKKALKLVLVLFSLFILGGCENGGQDGYKDESNPQLTCTLEQNKIDYQLSSNIKIFASGDYVVKLTSEEVLEAQNDEALNSLENSYKIMYDSFNEKFHGFTYKTEIKDGKLICNLEIDYEKVNLEAYVLETEGLTKYLDNGKLRIKGIKEMYESLGASCK